MAQPIEFDPWAPALLHTDKAAYFPNPSETTPKAVLFRGAENWLTRFATPSDSNAGGQAVKEEVQALFARWLRMQNLCVLLGAGASQYVTNFLNAGLLDRSADMLKGRPAEKTLEGIRKYASVATKPAQKIEQFLSQLQGLSSLFNAKDSPLDKLPPPTLFPENSGQNESEAIVSLLADLERAIAVACNVTLPPSALFPDAADGETPQSITPHETFLAKLMARDPQDGRAKIFTPNYDTLVEQAMDRLGILYCDGFTGTVGRRFNSAAYDLDYYFPGEVGEGRVRRYHKVVQLYKLHGSINWRRCAVAGALNPYGIRYDASPIPTAKAILAGDAELDDVFGVGEGLGILPTANKYGQSLAMPFAQMFRSFGHSLLQPQTVLFVIGYGGGDDHINQIVHDALVNPGFTCVIVDPYPSAWATNLCKADYCGRVYCVAGAWGFFHTFATNLLPDLEALKTEIEIARTLRELRSVNRDPADGTAETPGASGDPSNA